MDAVFSTALGGLTRAAGKAGQAAQKIVGETSAASARAAAPEVARAEPLAAGPARLGGAETMQAVEAALNQSPVQPGGAVGQTGLAGPMVDLSMAKHAYQASAKLLEAADQMQSSLLKADA